MENSWIWASKHILYLLSTRMGTASWTDTPLCTRSIQDPTTPIPSTKAWICNKTISIIRAGHECLEGISLLSFLCLLRVSVIAYGLKIFLWNYNCIRNIYQLSWSRKESTKSEVSFGSEDWSKFKISLSNNNSISKIYQHPRSLQYHCP